MDIDFEQSRLQRSEEILFKSQFCSQNMVKLYLGISLN